MNTYEVLSANPSQLYESSFEIKATHYTVKDGLVHFINYKDLQDDYVFTCHAKDIAYIKLKTEHAHERNTPVPAN